MEINFRFEPIKQTVLPEPQAKMPLDDKSAASLKASESLKDLYLELDQLIGLADVKKHLYEIQAFITMQNLRRDAGLLADSVVLHSVFKGSPGTGKTTIARYMAKIFKEMGILAKGHLIEVERADLVGEYVGHTAQKTKEQVKKALGGVLFIDEAYSLARGGQKDFGREAIDVLVKAMEDHKHEFILILAGYSAEMDQFISTNPGLNSRFGFQIAFPDYGLQELLDIAELMYIQREYLWDASSKQLFNSYLSDALRLYPKIHGNARLVRNLVEASLRKQAMRLMHIDEPSRRQLMQIDVSDISKEPISYLAPQKKMQDNCYQLFKDAL